MQVHGEELPWSLIANGFEFNAERLRLVSQQGIFKPKLLPEIPLSIRTSVSSPYGEFFLQDGDIEPPQVEADQVAVLAVPSTWMRRMAISTT